MFTTLHEAAGCGNLDAVDLEIASGADLNVVGKAGSPMYVAACSSQWAVVLRLLSAGANPNAGRCGKYPLSRAAEEGEDEVVKALLAAGADLNVVGCHNILQHDKVRRFHVDNAEFSPLAIAAWHKHWPVVQTLLAAGADVNDVAFDGSPLLWITRRSPDVFDALIADPRTDLNATFRTPKRHARADDPGNMYRYTLIAVASERDNWPLVLRLAAAGAKVDQFDAENMSALQRAVYLGRDDVVKALLDAGADPNLPDKAGMTSVHAARAAPLVHTLVAAGAAVDTKDVYGKTALRYASEECNSHLQEALIAAGANINDVDDDNVTILEHAVYMNNTPLALKLLDLGAIVDWTKDDETSLRFAILAGRHDIVDRLVAKGTVDANTVFESGHTPLIVAAESGRASMVTKLLGLGATVDPVDGRQSATALWMAAREGFEPTARLLLAAGADVNDASAGETALHAAAGSGHDGVARLLIDAGALIDTVAFDGDTPLLSAAKHGHWRVAATLARAQHALSLCNHALDLAIAAGPSAHGAVMALMSAGADLAVALERVVRSGNSDHLALVLAAGADATNAPVDAILILRPLLAAAGWQPPIDTMSPAELDDLHAAVPAARKTIERVGFAMVRDRVLEICVALQTMHLPAPQLIEIVTAECEPFAAHLPYHYLWDAVVLVKHFHDRSSAANRSEKKSI